jgi:DNA-binding transcriptional regulator GbsR (MarR family)
MPADEIAETLSVARSNVSNSLKELQNWNLIQIVHVMGNRKDHFSTSTDVWELFKTVVRERKEREFDPTIHILKACLDSPDFTQESQGAQQRIEETLALMESLSEWGEDMLELDHESLLRLMKIGNKVKFLFKYLP